MMFLETMDLLNSFVDAQGCGPAELIFLLIVLGLLFAIGILWWFLREKRATGIITLAVPISLMTTLIVLGMLGRSINVITLAGLAFATGMIMDAAIVVMENIVRHREKKMDKEEASDKGATQVWGALLASTATTVIIFLPVMFLEDVEGHPGEDRQGKA